MLKITLDANCVVNILDRMSISGTSIEELAEIVRYALESNVNVAITTRVENDLSKDKDAARRAEMLKRIQMFPVVGTIARLDTSRWDSGDVLGGDEHIAIQNEIQKIVFPGLKKEDKRYGNKINDIDHLIGHRINKRDIFVTDDGELLKKADELKASLGIVVMNPQKCVEFINANANPAVLVDEFSEKLKKYRDLLIQAVRIEPTLEMREEFTSLREWLMKK